MKVLKQEQSRTLTLNAQEIDSQGSSILGNPIALKILKELHNESMYPKRLAKKMKVHEQKVYYYIHHLEKAKLVKIVKEERLQGIVAKWYSPVSDSFVIPIGSFQESSKIKEHKSGFLYPFISEGTLNAMILVGSPDPHGPLKARSRDGYFGMDLALFLGTFLTHVPESKVKLDTEVQEKDLEQNNLIVIGGPIVNKVAESIGKRMPIYFDEEKKGFYSSITKRLYVHEEIGVINKCKNPFNDKKELLYIAGIRNAGTKAAILSFLKDFKDIEKGNQKDSKIFCKVVEGIDLDSDGIVDSIEFLE
ncbi:helix-turn-helix domain-containing protein [Candidatus Pacearchaeota archaeon]|nr:helix-turn-helix domain-containing protein [Candidatus Pacearchaeota archaeon]